LKAAHRTTKQREATVKKYLKNKKRAICQLLVGIILLSGFVAWGARVTQSEAAREQTRIEEQYHISPETLNQLQQDSRDNLHNQIPDEQP
jgi:hypothetical protein